MAGCPCLNRRERLTLIEIAAIVLAALVIGAGAGALWMRAAARRVSADVLAQAVSEASQLARALLALERRLELSQIELEQVRTEGARARENNAGLAVELEQERIAARDKLALLEQAREALTAQFKLLANEILEEKKKRSARACVTHTGQRPPRKVPRGAGAEGAPWRHGYMHARRAAHRKGGGSARATTTGKTTTDAAIHKRLGRRVA